MIHFIKKKFLFLVGISIQVFDSTENDRSDFM